MGPRGHRNLLAIPLAFGGATSTRLRQAAANTDNVLDATGTNPGPSFTIGVLVQPTTLTSGRAMYARDNAGGGHTLTISGTSGAVAMRSTRNGDTSADTITSSTGIIRANRWSFVFAVRDVTATTFLSIYSGSLARSILKDSATGTNGSGVLDNDSGRLTTIGNDWNGSPTVSFQGRIALACLFKRALSLTEMNAIRDAVLDGDCAPIGYLPQCLELVIPGEHGAGCRVNSYGRDSGLSFTQTTTKPCGAGSWPVGASRRRMAYKVPAVGGGSIQPPRSMHQFRMRAAR